MLFAFRRVKFCIGFFQNLEFARAVENQVEIIYRQAWPHQYFDLEVRAEKGVVYYWNRVKNKLCDSPRFKIFIFVPKKTRSYFLPINQWKQLMGNNATQLINTSLVSGVPHGFLSRSYPTTKSLYTPPFFIVLRTSPAIAPNYLVFNNFLVPNSEARILAMVALNENTNTFEPLFSPGLVLPLTNLPQLHSVLEFQFFDSKNKTIEILDNSQLFIKIKLIS